MELRYESKKKFFFTDLLLLKAKKQNGGILNLGMLLISYFHQFFMRGGSENVSNLCFKGRRTRILCNGIHFFTSTAGWNRQRLIGGNKIFLQNVFTL